MQSFLLALVLLAPPAPGFDVNLPDREGKPVTLAEYRGKSPVVVVFYRGSWCYYCVDQLTQLERATAKGEPLEGVPVIAISPDGYAKTDAFVKELARTKGVALRHRFVSDPSRTFAARYNPPVDGNGVPTAAALPKVVLLGRDGREAWTYSESHFQVRPLREALAEAMRRLRAEEEAAASPAKP